MDFSGLNLDFYKSESDTRPEEMDTTSSAAVVYFHRNIEQVTRTDPDGTERQTYQYEEAKVPRSKYYEYVNEQNSAQNKQNRADIEFIALMSDIPLE